MKNSCEPRKINNKCTKNDFKCPDYEVLTLSLKISGIEARNFSTKSFISCSEIVKTSLAVLMNNSIRRLKACTKAIPHKPLKNNKKNGII